MVIAIDGYEANVSRRVGIGRFAYEIIRHIHSLLKERPPHRDVVTVYLPTPPLDDMPPETPWWRYRIVPLAKLWTFVGLPLALSTASPKPHVIFSPTHYTPRFVSIPKICSIMDLSYKSYPKLFNARDLHQLTHWTEYSVRSVKKILAISTFTKRAIIDEYNVPSERVVVAYPGLTPMSPARTLQEVKKTYAIGSHYILSVGTLQPRKNYVRLIEAFSQLLRKDTQIASDIELVIVGKKGWMYQDILDAPKRFGVEGRVRFLDFVPDADLATLYRHALCLVITSLYEGFGLPVLEAMAHGTPVVVSNVSSLPEIAGEAGIYVDPQDVASITQGVCTAIEERGKKSGKDRIAAGLSRVKKFSWENAAKQTLAVLEEVGRAR